MVPPHETHALNEIARALREIPFYAKRGLAIDPSVPLGEALARLPLLLKKDLRATLPKAWVAADRDLKADLACGAVGIVETAGSTGERARVLHDRGWWQQQELRALQTNTVMARALGDDGACKLAMLATPASGMGTCNAGDLAYDARLDGSTLVVNQRPDPTYWKPEEMARMLEELARHETVGLIADPLHLATLARFARANGGVLAVRGFVVLTHGTTTAATRRAVAGVCDAPLFEVYGAREVGTLFVEGDDGKLHHAPSTTHVELLRAKVPTPGAAGVCLVVVTTLDRRAQPLVRYVVGDLVQIASTTTPPFSTVPSLVSVEGRVDDTLVRPDGAWVTAGALDRALADVRGVALFQANQRERDRVEVDVVLEQDAANGTVVAEVAARLASLLHGLTVDVRTVSALAVEPSGKLRIARRSFPIDYAASFEGCAPGH